MANYNTNLKTWGDKGTEYPNGHSQQDDVPPVDAWHDFLFYNQISDIQHLISLTNDRLETDLGSSYVSSPEDGHVMYRTDTETFEVYNSTSGAWQDLAWGADFRAHKNTVSGNPHSVTLEDARADNNTITGDIDINGNYLYTGNAMVNFTASEELYFKVDDGAGTQVDSLRLLSTGVEMPTGDLSILNGGLTVSGDTTFGTGTTLNMNDVVLSGNNSNTIDFGGASGHITVDADVRIADHVHWESDRAAFFGGLHNFSVRYASANDELLIKDEEAGNRVASFPKSSPAIMDNGLEVGQKATVHSGLTQGHNPNQVLNETTSPKGFDVGGNEHRDYSEKQVVHLSNGSTASATETVTVEFYDGTDTTGTLLVSESKSVSVAAGGSKQVSFNAQDVNLNNGTYHVNVTTSGTTLAVDQTDQHLRGAAYTFDQNATGDWQLTDEEGQKAFQLDAETNSFTSFPNINDGFTVTDGNLVQDISSGQLSLDSDNSARTGIGWTEGGVQKWSVNYMNEGLTWQDAVNNIDVLRLNQGGNVEIPNGKLGIGSSKENVQAHIFDSTDNSATVIQDYTGGAHIVNDKQTAGSYAALTLSHVDNAWNRDGDGHYVKSHYSANNDTHLEIGWYNDNGGTKGSGSIAKFQDTGNVEIPSGALTVANGIEGAALTVNGNGRIWSPGSGTDQIELRDAANSQEILVANEGGNVEISNGSLYLSAPDKLITEQDSSTTDDVFEFQHTDVASTGAEDEIKWQRWTAGTSAFRVWNNTDGNELFAVGDGGNVQIPNGSLTQGNNPGDTISESTSPTGWDFSGSDTRDAHSQNDVTISNGSTASATETVTVELYDGTDTTGTLVTSESKSVSVGAGASKTVTFIAGDKHLDNGTYHINITTSGTTLAIDKSVEYTRGAEFRFHQDQRGRLLLEDELGQNFARLDHIGNEWNFQGNNLTSVGNITSGTVNVTGGNVDNVNQITVNDTTNNNGVLYDTASGELFANISNTNGGGITVSDDGGFYDYDDGWLRFEGTGNGVDMNGNEIAFSAATNTAGAGGIRSAGYVAFANQENNDIPNRSIGHDDSEGVIYNDHNGNYRNIIDSPHGHYEVQKNGTDGNNIINFKT